jgi:spore maturation protein SpmB
VKLYRRFAPLPPAGTAPARAQERAPETGAAADEGEEIVQSAPYPGWVSALAFAVLIGLVPLTIFYGRTIAPWIIPGLTVGLLGFGMARRVRVYEAFVEGARDGFAVAVRIIPYLVAILVAVAMFRASGALDFVIGLISPVTARLGMPGEALPMALLRPLSGSGAYGVLASIIQDPAIGPDSYTGYLVSTIQGSTETTFYVIAVYFGAVQIRRIRHALAAALTADLAGVVAAVVITLYLFG